MTDTIREVPFHPGISKYSYERSIAKGTRTGLITSNDEPHIPQVEIQK